MAKALTPWSVAKVSEHSEQVAYFMWCNMAEKYGIRAAMEPACYGSKELAEKLAGTPVVALANAFAVPNGGSRGDSEKSRAIEGGKLKAEGVKSGVPDVLLLQPMVRHQPDAASPLSSDFWHGMALEFKRADGSFADLSENQTEWLTRMHENGYWCRVAFGWKQAVLFTVEYLQFDAATRQNVASQLNNVRSSQNRSVVPA